jgi:superfamily II helicase
LQGRQVYKDKAKEANAATLAESTPKVVSRDWTEEVGDERLLRPIGAFLNSKVLDSMIGSCMGTEFDPMNLMGTSWAPDRNLLGNRNPIGT